MTIRAVVFDIGGVLEDNPPTGWPSAWEARLGLRPGELALRLEQVVADGSVGVISEAEAECRIAERLSLDPAQLAALMNDMWAEYVGELNTELAGYFAALRPRYRTAILSNSFVGAREREEQRYGFAGICDLVVYSHEEGLAKPDHRFYELACRRLGVRPAEMILLDDVGTNVDAALEFGIRAIAFSNTSQAIADIEACLRSGSDHPGAAAGGSG
jgi:epoxide hydrolase-like predicted phosphatase